MGINVGDLRYSIKIKQLVSTKNNYGAITESYTTCMTLRAGKKMVSGTKSIDLDELFSSQTIQFTTHYRDVINETMRVEFSGKDYRILNINEVGFKEGLIILCELINK